jgi:urea transport system permease protein
MSPSFVGIVPSIEMVIFARSAAGTPRWRRIGRCGQLGQDTVLGIVLVPLFAMGGLFIAVVLAFPRGSPAW